MLVTRQLKCLYTLQSSATEIGEHHKSCNSFNILEECWLQSRSIPAGRPRSEKTFFLVKQEIIILEKDDVQLNHYTEIVCGNKKID